MENNSIFLSICITSYKRVNELKRCLYSIDSAKKDKIEVIVSEDCSSEREQIRNVVDEYAKTSPFKVVFNTNEQKLGYDRNLKKLATLATGEYVFYMSDDDCLFSGKLDNFIEMLEDKHPAMAYTSFLYGYNEKRVERRKYENSHEIPSKVTYDGKRIYDAILFTGLTFKREYLLDIDGERFKNMNYIQVYMFLHVLYHHGGYYDRILLIDNVSDGENAYGQVESSGKGNALLANRESVFSNLEFNKGLFKVIRMFDEDNCTDMFEQFRKEFSLRSLGGLYRARNFGLKTYNDYWKRLKDSGIKLTTIATIYYFIVLVLGAKLSKKLFVALRFLLAKFRKQY